MKDANEVIKEKHSKLKKCSLCISRTSTTPFLSISNATAPIPKLTRTVLFNSEVGLMFGFVTEVTKLNNLASFPGNCANGKDDCWLKSKILRKSKSEIIVDAFDVVCWMERDEKREIKKQPWNKMHQKKDSECQNVKANFFEKSFWTIQLLNWDMHWECICIQNMILKMK